MQAISDRVPTYLYRRSNVFYFSERPGIRVTVSKKLDDDTLAVLVKTMSECFTSAYYKARGILCTDDRDPNKPPVNL